ncbi:MAG: PIG-L deacetylase family protein [Sulfuricaulis sp.]
MAEHLRWNVRRREAASRTLAVLGVTAAQIAFGGFPHLQLYQNDPRVLHAITAVLADFQPTLVVAPLPLALHPDHNALGVLVTLALARQTDRSPCCLRYLVHSDPGAVHLRDIVTAESSTPRRALKREALDKHTTQTLLSRRRFMCYIGRASEMEDTKKHSQPSCCAVQFCSYRQALHNRNGPVHVSTLLVPTLLTCLVRYSKSTGNQKQTTYNNVHPDSFSTKLDNDKEVTREC